MPRPPEPSQFDLDSYCRAAKAGQTSGLMKLLCWAGNPTSYWRTMSGSFVTCYPGIAPGFPGVPVEDLISIGNVKRQQIYDCLAFVWETGAVKNPWTGETATEVPGILPRPYQPEPEPPLLTAGLGWLGLGVALALMIGGNRGVR
jgi:hypothetical protein